MIEVIGTEPRALDQEVTQGDDYPAEAPFREFWNRTRDKPHSKQTRNRSTESKNKEQDTDGHRLLDEAARHDKPDRSQRKADNPAERADLIETAYAPFPKGLVSVFDHDENGDRCVCDPKEVQRHI